ncbi:hypothetical protein LDENG_00238060 [Lucifuga dentata]|nr:hypothetical protein LDENG_00238060 [Lucifuga dentata]
MADEEIEAKEACDWLRAAGFPQYVQIFKDCRFPVDIECVKRDHHFLDKDALDSLCRRLSTLNKCVEMRLELRRSKHRAEDLDEEDSCAISPNWTFDRLTRRWRRTDFTLDFLHSTGSACDVGNHHDVCSIHSSSSTESEGHDGRRESHGEAVTVATSTVSSADDQETSRSSSRCSSANKTPSLDTSLSGPPYPGGSGGGSSTASLEADGISPDKLQRKKKSTSLLRKMEKLRLRGASALPPPAHSSSGRRSGRAVTGPLLVYEESTEDERLQRLHGPLSLQGRSSSQASSSPSSPHTVSSSSSPSESSSAVSTPSPVARVRSNGKRCNAGTNRNQQDLSDTRDYRNQVSSSSHDSLVFQIPHGYKLGTFPTSLAHKHAIIDNSSVNWRTGSFHGYRGRHSCHRGTSSLAASNQDPSSSLCDVGVSGPLTMPDHRLSIYDNVPDPQLFGSEGGSTGSDAEQMSEETQVSFLMADEDVFSALDGVLERISDLQQLVSSWSENLSEDNCQRGSSCSSSSQNSPAQICSSPGHIHLEVQHPEAAVEAESCEKTLPAVENQSVSHFLLLQKLSLLKLTSLMDKYSPSSKQGWSWILPKPLRKSKVVEVKGRGVFGVPLLLSMQQTGEPLPPSILSALLHLRNHSLDQVGLFRKSGVKSRIQYLRELVESDPDGVCFDGQSAFDVADMVKQYFRDLPEPVFTRHLCESFLHIYQYFPKDQQLAAAQAAILLLPDENREALRTLLFFLRDVVACVTENQMTPTNIAVCLAPSLFHLSTLKRDANAARLSHRKYSLGRPDQRDLSETLAATQGLASMISEAPRLFQLPDFWPGQRLSAAESWLCGAEGEGGAKDEQEEELRRLQLQTQHLLQEVREKSRGWQSVAAPEQVELAFKKVRKEEDEMMLRRRMADRIAVSAGG